MLEFAKDYPEVFHILPDEQGEIENLHRQYIANVIYTIAGDHFTKWIDMVMKERTEKITKEKNLSIQMDPAIYQVYKNSTSVSGKYSNTFTHSFLIQFPRVLVAIC